MTPRLRRFHALLACLALAAPLLSPAAARSNDVPTFGTDAMAVLSKAGCNMGVCHGNQNGKGGFKLSLRGEDPAFDFEALTRDLSGRRANPIDPERSLLLLKPTMQVPHEGGRRFAIDSLEYGILQRWIAADMPADSKDSSRLVRLEVTPREQFVVEPESRVTIRAQAEFSDGQRRDVTSLCVFEPDNDVAAISRDGLVEREKFGETTIVVRFLHAQIPVRLAFVPERADYTWSGPEPANAIDEHVFAKLRSLRMNPSPVAGDSVFLRRAYLDLLGLIPPADEAQAFVNDADPEKRARLIDNLLERPEFAGFWALKWSDMLRNEEKTLDFKGVQNFHAWIRRSIATGKPMDEFVRELIAARGSTYTVPAANYYRAMRDPLMRAESTAQLFLGVRLQCARCHNHPFDRWTQDDYYDWANLFARVDYHVLENRRRDDNDKHEFDGEQIVYMARKGNVENPRTGKSAGVRFLGAADDVDKKQDRLEQLAAWTTSPDNDLFVQTQVNRIWHALMGVGIVDPIDDFRATNPPSNPALLDALSREFVDSGFDLRHMIRLIMNSQTYQLASEPNDTNADDERNFSHAQVQRLTAEQLLDSLTLVTGVPAEFAGYPRGMRAGEIPGVKSTPIRFQPSEGDRFLKSFGKPERLQACECERSDDATLSQAMQLTSGPMINQMLTTPENQLAEWLASGRSPGEIIDELFWTALGRAPNDEERAVMTQHLETAEDRRQALEDLTWSILNSNEFLLRR